MELTDIADTLYEIIGRTPEKIQVFLDSLEYDIRKYKDIIAISDFLHGWGKRKGIEKKVHKVFIRSVLDMITDRKAICIEGAFAAAWLLEEDYDAQMLSFICLPKPGHMVCAYQDPKTGLFGAVGLSKYEHLKAREPVYCDEKSLAESYRCNEFDFDKAVFDKDFRKLKPDWGLCHSHL